MALRFIQIRDSEMKDCLNFFSTRVRHRGASFTHFLHLFLLFIKHTEYIYFARQNIQLWRTVKKTNL